MGRTWGRFACAVGVATMALASSSARADDEKVKTRRVRIPVVRDAERAPDAARPARTDPMATLLRVLGARAVAGLGQDPLDAWFAGGPDVPWPELRDALREDGWDAASLRAWFTSRALRAASVVEQSLRRAGAALADRAHDGLLGRVGEGEAFLLWRDGDRWRMEPIDVGPARR